MDSITLFSNSAIKLCVGSSQRNPVNLSLNMSLDNDKIKPAAILAIRRTDRRTHLLSFLPISSSSRLFHFAIPLTTPPLQRHQNHRHRHPPLHFFIPNCGHTLQLLSFPLIRCLSPLQLSIPSRDHIHQPFPFLLIPHLSQLHLFMSSHNHIL